MNRSGRDTGAKFADLFSKSLKVKVVTSAAFASLSASARGVLFIAFIKIDNARHHKRRLQDGRPVISFTATEAKHLLNISGPTHTSALRQLVEVGFLDQVTPGGLLGANGTASTYCPAKRWELWKPSGDHPGYGNITKALAAKKKKAEAPKLAFAVAPGGLEAGEEVYYYLDENRIRARKGTLLVETRRGWQIQGKRGAYKFETPIVEVPLARILTAAQLADQRRERNGRTTKASGITLSHPQQKPPLQLPLKPPLQRTLSCTRTGKAGFSGS